MNVACRELRQDQRHPTADVVRAGELPLICPINISRFTPHPIMPFRDAFQRIPAPNLVARA